MNEEKTRDKMIDGKKFTFACGGKDCCLGMSENPDGTLAIASTSGHIIP